MAAIRNPYPHSLFSVPLGRSVDALEVVDGLSDEVADAVTRSGIFERGYTAVVPDDPEAVLADAVASADGAKDRADATLAEAQANAQEQEARAEEALAALGADEEKRADEVEKRPAGRRTSKRGAAEAEETTQDDDEVETR